MSDCCEVAIIGSAFAGSIMARVLAAIGYDVVLLERGTHPRFAIGESTTPLANLSLERIALRYGLVDCYRLAAHGRWLGHYPDVRRGLKRGFTFYRHHPDRQLGDERLLVAASPNDTVADTHWLRADVDHHFVREAVAAGVDYRDRVEVSGATFDSQGIRLAGSHAGTPFELRAGFVIDASGPGGFLARQLSIPSGLERTLTRSGVVFSHFTGVRPMSDVAPDLPAGPYPDDWAAMHHVIDEGWMYSLRFDHGVTSAGFVLRADRGRSVTEAESPEASWRRLLARYPTINACFADATPLFPMAFRSLIQHRLTRAAGERWLLLPHAFAFVDPLFSTGIAWALRAIERVALSFEQSNHALPSADDLERYDALLHAEADQIDRMVAGAYEAMAHFDLFAAQAMLYFTAVSFAETRQRLILRDADTAARSGFLGVGDAVLEPLPDASLRRLRHITRNENSPGTIEERQRFSDWVREVIVPRNIGGFGEPTRGNLYPVDLDWLIDHHDALGLTRDQAVAALPALRGMAPEPAFT
jgi:FADH2 O2-dependent halogenase